MGNSMKKQKKSSPKSIPSPLSTVSNTTIMTNTNSLVTSAAPPSLSKKSNILLVCDDEFMKKEALDRLWAKSVNKEIEGHEISAYDLASEMYMFYGGRGGYRPLRRTVGGKLCALIVCIDNTNRQRKAHLTAVRNAIEFVTDGVSVPLLIIGMPPNEASKAAKRREEQQKMAAKKPHQESVKKRVMKSIKNKFNPSSNDDKADQQDTTKTVDRDETPMNTEEIEALLNDTLALQTKAFFPEFLTISLNNTDTNNNDDTLTQAVDWLKKQLKGEITSNVDDQPPAVVKDIEETAPVNPFIVAPRTEVNVTAGIDGAEIVASA